MNLFDEPQLNNHHQAEKPFIMGKVITTFFEGADSFYKVLLVKVEKTNTDWHEDEIVVTGNFADIAEETSYRFVGKLVEHPRYGKQFQTDNYERANQTSPAGLIKYLASDDFPGIGQKTAEKVVKTLGGDLIEKILSDPSVIKKVGLKPKQNQVIVDGLRNNNGAEQVIVGLNGYGFGSTLAAAVFKQYREKALEVIQENPYQLVEDIKNISFKRADQIANKVGVEYNSAGRLRAGLLTTLTQLSIRNGNTYSNTKELINASFEVLDTDPQQQIDNQKLAQELKELVKDHKIEVDDEKIYLKYLYDDEWKIAENAKRIMDDSKTSKKDYSPTIHEVESEAGIKYDDLQISAINAALKNQIFILTGGPGTGKTTIINGIVQSFAKVNQLSLDVNKYKDESFPVLLAAPTGRAAKKMSESTGIPASTIHRLLGLNGNDEEAGNDIDGQLLIIDEMSMVDTELFTKLMKAIPTGMKVILVGDKDQLPSVGPGQVFYDLIRSEIIPKIELNQIHRQGDGSTIIQLAHEIKNGEVPQTLLEKETDRSFIQCHPNQVVKVIDQIVAKAKQKQFKATDVQVLAPMYRGEVGIDRLNNDVQSIMNPSKGKQQKEVEYQNLKYRIGDKVLQLVNAPEDNVFNGDIGKVVGIDINKDQKKYLDKLIIAFDQTEVSYTRKDWNQLTLAYCTSIHKAQGSEFKMVILPIVPQYRRMLERNLLYTAVTRASQKLIMVGDPNSFAESIAHISSNRKTSLRERLENVFGHKTTPKKSVKSAATEPVSKATQIDLAPVEYILTETNIFSNQIDPMIGMDGIKPNDFMDEKSE
ncbi:ATP-dependent RecD-like DNA helicase [Fructilactobacillus frigidiflavus]|uniref:SF1B family DNA helicase RecD2 n=1 Tax=Fructilactobacillus frigidiflavus TaxID=3242688 RepID=UPI0037583248